MAFRPWSEQVFDESMRPEPEELGGGASELPLGEKRAIEPWSAERLELLRCDPFELDPPGPERPADPGIR